MNCPKCPKCGIENTFGQRRWVGPKLFSNGWFSGVIEEHMEQECCLCGYVLSTIPFDIWESMKRKHWWEFWKPKEPSK